MKGSPVISQQSDYTVLQISQEAIQNCDTSEYVTLLHGATDSLQSFESAFQRYVFLITTFTIFIFPIFLVLKRIGPYGHRYPFWHNKPSFIE